MRGRHVDGAGMRRKRLARFDVDSGVVDRNRDQAVGACQKCETRRWPSGILHPDRVVRVEKEHAAHVQPKLRSRDDDDLLGFATARAHRREALGDRLTQRQITHGIAFGRPARGSVSCDPSQDA